MSSIGPPIYINSTQAFQYASNAGFNNTLVVGTGYTQIQVIVGIAGAESTFNIKAYNPTDPNGGSFGILQINGFWFGHGIDEAGALDPQTAFNFAYTTISRRGTSFTDWSTFTSGAYKANIPNLPGQGPNPLNTTPQKGWWDFPRVDNLGVPDPFGGFPKPDSNIQLPDNYPIINILNGVVSGINNPNGSVDQWGAAVTIKLDQPLNNLADHISYIHLSKIVVRQGQRVQQGDLIGYNGGNAAAGTQKVPMGVALYHGDFYGHDGFQYETTDNLKPGGKLNIVPLLDNIKAGNFSLSLFDTPSIQSNQNGLQTFIENFQTAKIITLKPNDSVVNVLKAFDELTSFSNPFSVVTTDPNPANWAGEIAFTMATDFVAFFVRFFLIILGMYICFKVINNFINISGTIQSGLTVARALA